MNVHGRMTEDKLGRPECYMKMLLFYISSHIGMDYTRDEFILSTKVAITLTRKLRWGVIGSASIAVHSVIPGIKASETGELTAIASRGIERAEETAAKLGIPKAYGSYEEILADPDIDAIYVPLPNHLHMEWSIRAMEAGKHVLCEKPIAMNAEEAQRMADAAAKNGVHLAEAFMYRHPPALRRDPAMVASGEIGDIRGIHGTFTFNNAGDAKNVRYRKEWGGGSLYDVGCYPISAARLDSRRGARSGHGARLDLAGARQRRHDGVRHPGIPERRGADVRLRHVDRVPQHARDRRHGRNHRGAFRIRRRRDLLRLHEGRQARSEAAGLNQYALQADAFARNAWGERDVRFAPADAVANMKVIDACLESAYSRKRVLV